MLSICMCVQYTQSRTTFFNPMDQSLLGSSVHGDALGKNIGVGFHALRQEIFPTLGLKPGLPHSWQSLYHLSHWICIMLVYMHRLIEKINMRLLKTIIIGLQNKIDIPRVQGQDQNVELCVGFKDEHKLVFQSCHWQSGVDRGSSACWVRWVGVGSGRRGCMYTYV